MENKTNNNKYNFKHNLIALSESKDIDTALNEWNMINKQPETRTHSVCICQKVIKHVHYLYNVKTHKFAFVGTACVKKFNHEFKTVKSKTFRKVIMNLFGDGIYERIDDLDLYSEEVKAKVISYFETGLNHKTNQEKITEIECLINDFGCVYLECLLLKYKEPTCEQEDKTYQQQDNKNQTSCSFCGCRFDCSSMNGVHYLVSFCNCIILI